MSKIIEHDQRPGQPASEADEKPARRGFLFGAGVAAGVAGVAALALKVRAQPAADVAAPETAEAAPETLGYHETAHIRRYYETTKV